MRFGHRMLTVVSGALWLAMGLFLILFGLTLIRQSALDPTLSLQEGKFSLFLFFVSSLPARINPLAALLGASLFLGYLKGHFALKKAVHRQVERILKLPRPIQVTRLFSPGYYLLIGLMVLLGLGMRLLPITCDTRGAIDLTIGTALIYGSLQYFRCAATTNFYTIGKQME